MIHQIQRTIDEIKPHLGATIARLRPNSSLAAARSSSLEKFAPDFRPPSLSEVIRRDLPAPNRSILLGVGVDDGVYFLDLDNPVSGAVSIIGDRTADITGMMRSMLASATLFNPHQRVSVSVICRNVDDYSLFVQTQHLHDLLPLDEPIASEFILEVAAEAEDRSRGKIPEPAGLLFIDDLSDCLDFLNRAAYERLYWLIRHGPRYKIWTIASLKAEKLEFIDRRFLSAFRSWLVGCIGDTRLRSIVAHPPSPELGRLMPDQFIMPDRDHCRLINACKID